MRRQKTSLENTGADLSPCRTWRYALWRHWDQQVSEKCVLFIGLNPSTANETKNDTTISKCIGFAKKWGYGGVYMLNLFAYRATKPIDMVQAPDPIGPDNDNTLTNYRTKASMIVAAWGSLENRYRLQLKWQSRITEVLDCINQPVHCLGKTKDGSPRHPSRLGYNTQLEIFWEPNVDKYV